MATSQLSDGVYLRSTINATPAADPQVLSAFSSDIIPLGHTQPDIATLVAAYSNFIAHEIDPSESKTRIYLRGKAVINGAAKKVETQVSLKTIPNELILWPQAWENAAQIGQATLSASKDGEVVVTNTPIVYNPTQGLGRHDTLIAEATTGASTTTLVQQVHNWRDLVKLVGEDATLATYNVVFADPCSTNVSLTTRLRVFENQASSVNMAFGIEAVGTPASDIDVSLVGFGTTTGSKPITFGQSRTNILPSKLLNTPAILPKDFDGTVTLNVFNDKKQTFGDYSSISVIAYAVTAVGGKETYTTLGAEHIVFHSDTRVKKVLNKFARLREAAVIQDVTNAATSIGPSFYFRMTVNDTDQFPRPESDTPEHSCDIQPWGTLPDANVQSDLGPANYRVDVSDKRNVSLVANLSNYIYLRGTTTVPASGSVRLFAIPSSVLLHPSQYSTQGCIIYDHTSGGDPKIAIRKYNTTAAEAPVLFSEPFNFSDPPPPPGQDHYCLIAECKPDGLDADGNSYEWPHQETGDFATGPEFITWLRSNPCVCQRNICYISNPNAPSQVFYTSFTIPASFSASDVWIFQVHALNCPSGSYIEMDSSDADIKVGKLTITGSDQTAGAEFTGKAPGFTCQVVIRWYANGTKVQDGQQITGNLALQLLATSITGDELFRRRNTGKPSVPAVRTVTHDYPNVKIPAEDNTGDKQPPKIGGAHPCRVLGEKYRLNAAIYIDYIVGTDGMGYNIGLA
ncbi:hypothetical protein IEO21_10142 [Rhodonia placenta]|uniref:Uncharacterized protein n=1 Tax=Rhodonia placenta TaxID=104341 RepID=A0A8H7NT70_9APHY|nr:hypothetical protein IEO21_10142 [Postia placenta]